MTNRLTATFDAARRENRKLLCPFLTAGYPDAASTVALLQAAQRAGAGVVELGIPFSDPVADGPTIQASFTHALSKGLTVDQAIAIVAQARAAGVTIPIVGMVSFSIVFKRGTRAFAKACADAGIDGLILPDVSLEEAPDVVAAIREYGLRTCLLVAPTSTPERRAAIASLCDGFVYYLSVSGITGERKELPTDIGPNVAALRQVTRTPICVGFGISTAAQVRQVVAVSDGAIVGSAVIRRIAEHASEGTPAMAASVEQFLRELSQGLNL